MCKAVPCATTASRPTTTAWALCAGRSARRTGASVGQAARSTIHLHVHCCQPSARPAHGSLVRYEFLRSHFPIFVCVCVCMCVCACVCVYVCVRVAVWLSDPPPVVVEQDELSVRPRWQAPRYFVHAVLVFFCYFLARTLPKRAAAPLTSFIMHAGVSLWLDQLYPRFAHGDAPPLLCVRF
jgi:hypothetical protein